MPPDEPPADRYRRQLRDQLVAGLHFRRIPLTPPPTQNPELRRGVLYALAFLSEYDLKVPDPGEGVILPVWEEVTDDVLSCIEQGRRDRLVPTAEAVRLRYRDWLEMSWLGKLHHVFLVGRVPVVGDRKLNCYESFDDLPWVAWWHQMLVGVL